MHRSLMTAGALCGAFLICGPANAAPGTATGNVNMRTGPGTGYAVIATIPAGAAVDVIECGGWCQVSYAGRTGYASANYIATGTARAQPPAYYEPAPQVYYEPAPQIYYEPAPPPVVYWGFGSRGWDHRYSYWRDRHWRHDRWPHHRWPRHDRPGISFEFDD